MEEDINFLNLKNLRKIVERKKHKEISCIGISYIQPILDLYSKLDTMTFSGSSKIRLSSNENGYSVSIVSLIVFCIESLINNLRYHQSSNATHNLDFLLATYPKYKKLFNKINELITVRNAIAHNHIWVIEYETDENHNELNIEKTRLDGYGQGAFHHVVNFEKKETKILKMRIIPTRIGKLEAKQSLLILGEFSDFLDSVGFRYISNSSFKFNSKNLSLKKVISKIR